MLNKLQNLPYILSIFKRSPGKPNIDLSPNKMKGAYIAEGSLSIWGLKCMQVPLKQLNSFEQWKAKI